MVDSKVITSKLLELIKNTGYNIVQHNGQRKYGPPPNWSGPPPPKGCEVFIGKLPREIFEDELVPVFSKVGKIYEMRLMMDFSGSNRGYAFVTYVSPSDASRAVRELNGYEIRKGKSIGVVKSVDNCRLFIGGIPKTKTREEILQELSKRVAGIVNVILYKNCFDRRLNRGFAFVEFTSHRAAAMARRALVPGFVRLWNQEVMVDWAEPEPEIDEEKMKQVKVLYVRNFLIKTTPQTIQSVFESAINDKIQCMNKIYDYAFIHFFKREHAELAMTKLQNTDIDGSIVEIKWAKPVNRELYKIQKMARGNAKFNTASYSQIRLLNKGRLNKREYAASPKEDEGIGSACAGESPCGTPTDAQFWNFQTVAQEEYSLAPAKLDALCKRYSWAPPVYEYQKFVDPIGTILWTCKVELPSVNQPLTTIPQRVGPFMTRVCYSMQQSQTEAADLAINHLKMLQIEIVRHSTPMPQIPQLPQVPPVYPPSIVHPLPACVNVPYDFLTNPLFQQPILPMTSLCDRFDNFRLF